MAEARKLLAPPMTRPEAPSRCPRSSDGSLEDPSCPAMAASELAQQACSGMRRATTDSWHAVPKRGEGKICGGAAGRGGADQATGPRARKKGAIFMVSLQGGLRWDGGGSAGFQCPKWDT